MEHILNHLRNLKKHMKIMVKNLKNPDRFSREHFDPPLPPIEHSFQILGEGEAPPPPLGLVGIKKT